MLDGPVILPTLNGNDSKDDTAFGARDGLEVEVDIDSGGKDGKTTKKPRRVQSMS